MRHLAKPLQLVYRKTIFFGVVVDGQARQAVQSIHTTHDKDNWYGYTSPRMVFFNSDKVIPDVPFGTGFLVATKIGTMDIPHVHDGAYNFFVFTGAELDRIFEAEFGIGFCIGDSAQSVEIYHITKQSIVCAPPGVFHSPVYFKKVVRGLNTMLF